MAARFAANSSFARSADAVGWALFFVWVGIALLAHIGWTASLVGTAGIILCVQGALFLRGERVDIFMSAVGLVLLVGTVADLLGSAWSLLPAMLIVVGLVMLGETFRARPRAAPRAGDAPAARPDESGSVSPGSAR